MRPMRFEERQPAEWAIRPGSRQAADRLETIDRIRRRRTWLTGQDRLLIEMVYIRGSTCRQIAALTNMTPSSVSRRIRKLTERLLDRRYPICLRHRERLSPVQLAIARDRFIAGLSRKAIARRYKCSLYRVDRHLKRLNELIHTHTTERTQKPSLHLNEGA